MHWNRTIPRMLLASLALVICAAAPATAAGAKEPARLLQKSDAAGGLVVHVGCGSGRQTEALHRHNSMVVHGLDRDREDVKAARQYVRSQGSYGDVSIRHWDGKKLPYADNLVNILVARGEALGDVPKKEIMRVLAPLGAAYIKRDGEWTALEKEWPDDMDEWTHWMHDPTRNAVARDAEVGPPRHIQWEATPRWQRHHNTVPGTSAMVSANGRLFYVVDEAPPSLAGPDLDRWYLVARDAFNGLLLWKRPLKNWGWKAWSNTWLSRGNQPLEIGRRFVAVGDKVFATMGFDAPLSVLDAVTGETLRRYEGTEGTDEIMHCGNRLILARKKRPGKPGRDRKPVHKQICCLDPKTGTMQWKKNGYVGLHAKKDSVKPFGRVELTAGEKHVFLMDKGAVICLDMKSGETVWRRPRPRVPKDVTAYFSMRPKNSTILLYEDGVLLLSQPKMMVRDPHHTIPGTTYAFEADTGKLLWTQRAGGWSHCVYQPDTFVIDGLVWLHKHVPALEGRRTVGIRQGKNLPRHKFIPPRSKMDYELLGLDLHTGEVKRRISTRRIFNIGHHHRCYRNRATNRYILSSRRGVEFTDLSSGENYLNHWVRGTCLFGYLPCNGLLYAPPGPCNCYPDNLLHGYHALADDQDGAVDAPLESWTAPLEKGPAFGTEPAEKKAGADAWPTFRHDARRSGSSSTTIGPKPTVAWESEAGGELTAVTAADGTCWVARPDAHQVVALDAGTGKQKWAFTAGAGVDSPPTYYRGLVLFGSRDGWAYCLRADDGRLVWRRRIAPRDRFVGAGGGFESAWPVFGSLLIQDGLAYAVAGRSSYLDGGIFVCALKPQTGDVVQQKNIYSLDPETGKQPKGSARRLPGTLPDVPVSNGTSVFIRRYRVFGSEDANKLPVHSTAGMLDGSMFNRTFWRVGNMSSHPQLLVCRNGQAWAMQAYEYRGVARGNFFVKPGDKPSYRLFRTATSGGKKGKGWSKKIPVRVRAMALADTYLFVCGPPDLKPKDDPLAAFDGKQGSRLWTVSADSGKVLSRQKLKALPVWDGMAAASGRLFLPTRDGRVICFEAGE